MSLSVARKASNQKKSVVIGDNNFFEEQVVIHRGLLRHTRIGSRSAIGCNTHVAHDVTIGDHVIINACVSIGGYSWVGDYANIGMGVSIHQRTVVGDYCIVGLGAAVIHNVQPGAKVAGNPARFISENALGLHRAGFNNKEVSEFGSALLDLPNARMSESVEKAFDRFFDAVRQYARRQSCLPHRDFNRRGTRT